jgi:uncharacterized glyoxalase superfamily protein PhnB
MAKVKPIPEGFHSLTPHIVVRGAAQAIEFYKKAFGAVEIRRAPMPDGKALMHADIKIGDSHLMLVDEMPGMGFVEDVDAVMKRAEAAGAKVTKPPMDMFWGDRYGALTDPFGHDWSVATHKEDVTPEEMKKRGDALFAEMAKGKH